MALEILINNKDSSNNGKYASDKLSENDALIVLIYKFHINLVSIAVHPFKSLINSVVCI